MNKDFFNKKGLELVFDYNNKMVIIANKFEEIDCKGKNETKSSDMEIALQKIKDWNEKYLIKVPNYKLNFSKKKKD